MWVSVLFVLIVFLCGVLVFWGCWVCFFLWCLVLGLGFVLVFDCVVGFSLCFIVWSWIKRFYLLFVVMDLYCCFLRLWMLWKFGGWDLIKIFSLDFIGVGKIKWGVMSMCWSFYLFFCFWIDFRRYGCCRFFVVEFIFLCWLIGKEFLVWEIIFMGNVEERWLKMKFIVKVIEFIGCRILMVRWFRLFVVRIIVCFWWIKEKFIFVDGVLMGK